MARKQANEQHDGGEFPQPKPFKDEVVIELCQKIYKAGFIDYRTLEKELGTLKKEGILKYEHLERIQEKWELFPEWYAWPAKEQLQDQLKQAKISFRKLNHYKGNDRDYKREKKLFHDLFKVLKHTELVSIVLRFVDPDHFGIYSPPVVFHLRVPRGINYEQEYIKYLGKLREYKKIFEQARAADTDMTLWALAKIQEQPEMDLKEESDLAAYQAAIDKNVNLDLIGDLLPQALRGKTRLEGAKFLLECELYNLAAADAGRAFERAIKYKCIQVQEPLREDNTGEKRKLAALIEGLVKRMGLKKPVKLKLEKANEIRNKEAHLTEGVMLREQVIILIKAAEEVESWLFSNRSK